MNHTEIAIWARVATNSLRKLGSNWNELFVLVGAEGSGKERTLVATGNPEN